HKFGERWWWHQQYIFLRDKWHWLRSQGVLLTHLRRLASGERYNWLGHLSMEALEQNNLRWAPDTWDLLEKKRGRLITWATKTGCKRAWRLFWPPLPHEEQK